MNIENKIALGATGGLAAIGTTFAGLQIADAHHQEKQNNKAGAGLDTIGATASLGVAGLGAFGLYHAIKNPGAIRNMMNFLPK